MFLGKCRFLHILVEFILDIGTKLPVSYIYLTRKSTDTTVREKDLC